MSLFYARKISRLNTELISTPLRFGTHISSTNPLDEDTLARIQSWTTNCRTQHQHCPIIRQEVQLPRRLIALDTLPSPDAFATVANHVDSWRKSFQDTACRLIETEPGDKGQYATLSYCWGLSLPFTTTTESLQQHCQAIVFNQLPCTLQDAVMLARYLGFMYIWIDCLCIVQDDRKDWQRESAKMAAVRDSLLQTETM